MTAMTKTQKYDDFMSSMKAKLDNPPYTGEQHAAYLVGIQMAMFSIRLAELWRIPDNDLPERYLDLMNDLQDKMSESPYLDREKTAYQTGIQIAMLKLGQLYDPNESLPISIYDQITPGMKVRQGDTVATVISIMPPGAYSERMPDGSTVTTCYKTERVTLQYGTCAETPGQVCQNRVIAMPRHDAIKLLQKF